MNRTTVIGGVAVVVVIVLGFIFYRMPVATPTLDNATSTQDGGTTGQVVTQTPGTPIAVTNTAASPTDTSVFLIGAVTPNGAFASYWYEYGTSNNFGNKSVAQSIGSGFAPIGAPAYITGLTKDTTYFYRLVAQNQFDTAMGVTYSFTTTHGVPAPVGGIPSVQTLQASSISKVTATLNGDVGPNKASTTNWFEYGTTANLGNTTPLSSVGSGSVVLKASIALTNLTPATTYYFRLNAQNQFGTVTGEILTFTTAGPAVATGPSVSTLAANGISSSTANLRGNLNPNGSNTSYWFEYSHDLLTSSVAPKTTSPVAVVGGETQKVVEVSISGLNAKTIYYVRLVAQNTDGLIRGNILTFKTK